MKLALFLCLAALSSAAWPQAVQRVVDLPTRPGITQRFLFVAPDKPTMAAVMMSGGNGFLGIFDNGSMRAEANFVARERARFAAHGVALALVDVPSDRRSFPYMGRFRLTPEHLADVKAVIAWMRKETGLPVWLVGNSRGSQSAAYVATEATPAQGGPDAVVLMASILSDANSRPVPDLPLEKIAGPVLVLHHRRDQCEYCLFAGMPRLTERLKDNARTELLAFDGGYTKGNPCEPFSYHNFLGIEDEVVAKTVAWMEATKLSR